MNLSNESLLDWVVNKTPPWAHDIIRDMEQDYPFQTSEHGIGLSEFVYLTEHANIDVYPETIVGQRDHYSGQSWIDAIINPKWKQGKIQACLRLADSNPDYYFQDLSGIHLTSYDGMSWYSDNGGNHRTIVGKFMMAMVSEQTNTKRHFKNVSTTRRHIDHEIRSIYMRLLKLISEANIQINLDIASVPNAEFGRAEIRVFVWDGRWGVNMQRFGWISTTEFAKFADWVISSDGVLSKWDRLRSNFSSLDHRRLIYPGMSKEFLSPPAAHLLISR